jgi:hypothetical protein
MCVGAATHMSVQGIEMVWALVLKKCLYFQNYTCWNISVKVADNKCPNSVLLIEVAISSNIWISEM